MPPPMADYGAEEEEDFDALNQDYAGEEEEEEPEPAASEETQVRPEAGTDHLLCLQVPGTPSTKFRF